MIAALLKGADQVEVVEDWPEPVPGPDEVVVAVEAVGICGTDVALVSGRRHAPSLPWVVGHEAMGRVEVVGPRVSDREPGERVVIEPNFACLACPACLAGTTSLCTNRAAVGVNRPGLMASRVVVPAHFAWPVAEHLTPEEVICIEPLAVAIAAVRRSGSLPGDRCLVVGAGPLGLLVGLVLHELGASVFVEELKPSRRDLARQLDFATVEPGAGDFARTFETSGSPGGFERAVAALAPGGVATLLGESDGTVGLSSLDLVRRQVTVRGSLIYEHPGDFREAIARMEKGYVPAGQLVGAPVPVQQVAQAFADCAELPGKSWIVL